MKTYLLDNNSENLIVFFCGWGMSETPFLPLKITDNILFLYDYENLDLNFDFSPYKKKTLLAFSYGVYVCGLVQEKLPEFDTKIALNGTLIPVSDEYGVPLKKFLLSKNMSSDTIIKFRERLFYNKNELDLFNERLPERTAESCTNELKSISGYFKSNPHPAMEFDKVIISSHDKVIPSKNQRNYWEKFHACTTIEIENGHFPFYSFDGIDELCLINHS